MKQTMCLLAMVFVLCALQANAQVVIQQVLYDPIKTESGGEAIELKNTGNDSADISGWVIATDNSAKDATIPQNTVIDAGATYLIADEGWTDGKDNDSWRAADYEETITLGNQNGGVAILDASGTTIDALGWGNVSDKKLFSGMPAKRVAAGKVLMRVKNNQDNSVDFVEANADFEEGIAVTISAVVKQMKARIVVSESLDLSPDGTLSIKNIGGAPAHVKLVLNDLVLRNLTIAKTALSVDGPTDFVVQPGEEHQSRIVLDAPQNALAGIYTSTLRVITLSDS